MAEEWALTTLALLHDAAAPHSLKGRETDPDQLLESSAVTRPAYCPARCQTMLIAGLSTLFDLEHCTETHMHGE